MVPALGENDRSATSYLPKAEFDVVANPVLSTTEESIRSWERAIDAQRRIVGAVGLVIAAPKAEADMPSSLTAA